MPQIHPNARTTPLIRAEIARSDEPARVLATRYGVSAETVRKWRRRGAEDCLDRSARPRRLPWKASEQERAAICALRRATGLPLDDLTFVLRHFWPRLNRHGVWRTLRAEGLNRNPRRFASSAAQGRDTPRSDRVGVVHIGAWHLPALRTGEGERHGSSLFVALDQRSRSVHLAMKDSETEEDAVAFLRQVAQVFPFRLAHVMTGAGACFSSTFADACAALGARHRRGRARTVRASAGIGIEGLEFALASLHCLEEVLHGLESGYNARASSALDGKTPEQVVAEDLAATPHLRASHHLSAITRPTSERPGSSAPTMSCDSMRPAADCGVSPSPRSS